MRTGALQGAQATAQPHMADAAPAYSVVVEWENVRLAEAARPSAMLRALAASMHALERDGVAGELLLVHDPAEVGLERHLREALAAAPLQPRELVRLIGVAGCGYYEKKNAGARAARGALVAFLDSDVVPEPDWLRQLLAPFADREIDVVGGATYVEARSTWERAFAAFWFFPPRSEATGLAELEFVFANNLAFRRVAFLGRPFAQHDTFRGQASALIADLRRAGARIVLQPAARCAHPPPNGLVHLVRRGICEGHDQLLAAQRDAGGARVPWSGSWRALRWLHASARSRIRSRAGVLRLDRGTRAVAHAIAAIYSACALTGHVLTRIDRRIVPRWFAI